MAPIVLGASLAARLIPGKRVAASSMLALRSNIAPATGEEGGVAPRACPPERPELSLAISIFGRICRSAVLAGAGPLAATGSPAVPNVSVPAVRDGTPMGPMGEATERGDDDLGMPARRKGSPEGWTLVPEGLMVAAGVMVATPGRMVAPAGPRPASMALEGTGVPGISARAMLAVADHLAPRAMTSAARSP